MFGFSRFSRVEHSVYKRLKSCPCFRFLYWIIESICIRVSRDGKKKKSKKKKKKKKKKKAVLIIMRLSISYWAVVIIPSMYFDKEFRFHDLSMKTMNISRTIAHKKTAVFLRHPNFLIYFWLIQFDEQL